MKAPAVYMLASQKNATLYLGVTSDLIARVGQHREAVIDGFSKQYGVKTLVWFEQHETMESAINREMALKKWNRDWKVRLIEKLNPEWRDLWSQITDQLHAGDFAGNPAQLRHPREGGDPVQVSAFSTTSKEPQSSCFYANQQTVSSASLDSRMRGNDDRTSEHARSDTDVSAQNAVDFPGSSTPPRHPRVGGDPVQVSAFSTTSKEPQSSCFYANQQTVSSASLDSRLRGNDDRTSEHARSDTDVSAQNAVDFASNFTPPRHPREGGDPVQVSAFSPWLRAPQSSCFYANQQTVSSASLDSRLRGNDDKVVDCFASNFTPPRHPRVGGDPVQVSAFSPGLKARQSSCFYANQQTVSSASLDSRLRGNDDKVAGNFKVLQELTRKSKCQKTARGFTLIEILLVIGIMAVITTIVAVQVMGSLDSAKVASAGRDLMAAMRYTRGAALLQHQSQAVIFDVEKKTYQVPGKDAVELPEEMEIELFSATEEQLDDKTGAIRFYPDGGSTGGQVKLSVDGRSWTVQVAWLTGDIGLVDSAKVARAR